MLRILFRHFFLLALPVIFFWPNFVLAAEPPILISPIDNETVSINPKFVWDFKGICIEAGSCFRVEIDNNSDFTSVEKQIYTKNYSYSPKGLSEGIYYWRIRAKDNNNKWSDWSKVSKANLSLNQEDTEDPAASDESIADGAETEDVFEIKNIASEINSDQEIEVSVYLRLPDKIDTAFYIKGAFKKPDSINYFGETYSGNSWGRNNSSYSAQYKIETNSQGIWEGKIKARPDPKDSGFKGSGDYNFRVGRYTSNGNGPVWSNDLSLKINEVKIPETSPSPEPSIEIEEEPVDEEAGILLPEEIEYALPSVSYDYKIASVAGEATMSNNVPPEEETKVLEERKINWLLIIFGAGILAGGGGYTFYNISKSGKKI